MRGTSYEKHASRPQPMSTVGPRVERLASSVTIALLLGVLWTLGGCKVGPNFTTPAANINSKWSAEQSSRVSTQTATDQQWWKTFQDEVLNRLVELAYRQNLPLQIAGLRIVEGRARLGIAQGKLYPQTQEIFGGVSAVGVPKPLSESLGFKRNLANYQLGFDAAWEADLWGKYRRGVESDTASLLATVADYYAAIVSLTAEVARTYAVVRTFEVRIDLAVANAKLQEESLRIAESRFRNGATSELDVAQATTLLESTRASIPQLRSSLQQARNALSTLLGQPPGTVESLLMGPKEIPKAPANVAVSVPAEMLRRRPDIRAAELNAAAQCARIGIAKAELYPSFSLFGAFGLWGNNTGRGSHNLFSADSIFYAFGPRVNWPVLNYGRLTNNVRVQDALFEQALVNYHDTVLNAAQEVEDALSGFLNDQEALGLQERSVVAAQRSEEIAVVQYREGAVDFQRVVDAQRFLLQQQNELAQIRSSVSTNLIALYKALGGGWEVRRDQPVVSERMRKEMQDRTSWGDMLTEPRAQESRAAPPEGKQ
jgi:NodT family efflux transporter outer membrane factor (OMF) lipoprotein